MRLTESWDKGVVNSDLGQRSVGMEARVITYLDYCAENFDEAAHSYDGYRMDEADGCRDSRR